MRAHRWAIAIIIQVIGGLIGAFALWGLTRLATPLFQPVKPGAPFYLALAGSVAVWVGGALLLHRSPPAVKKRVIIIATFAAGLFYPLQFYLPEHSGIFFWRASRTNPFSPMMETVGIANAVIGGFTFFLGAFNLALIHSKNIIARRAGYFNSIAFFISFIAMAVFGLWKTYAPQAVLIHSALGLHNLSVDRVHSYLFDSMYVPLGATLFSVLAFYMATAAFRAFRVRSAEAGFMMVAAFLCMMGQVPLGMWVTHHLPLTGPLSFLRMEALANWILGVFSMAGLRAVGFGILVGGLAMSLRVWLNLERGAFFEQEL